MYCIFPRMALNNAKEHKLIFYIRIYQVVPIPQIKINQEFRELVMFRFELEKIVIHANYNQNFLPL